MAVVEVDLQTPAATSYRAARVKSLFNATDEQATRFRLAAELGDLDGPWSVGVIVGPSGSGKTSLGRALWEGVEPHDPDAGWPEDAPIVDGIAPGGSFDEVTAALAAAGLGDVPAWLRPYRVLSRGQQFRADLARVLAEKPQRVILDEFTSVVDRQIAQVGAGAFAKSWRRTGGKAVILSCHYDVLDWLEPDWVYDTALHRFRTREQRDKEGDPPWRRPRIDLEIRLGGWELWPLFEPHHYLRVPRMIGAKCYVAFVGGEPVAHVGMGTRNFVARDSRGRRRDAVEARACRLVVLPEWQGAGVGMRFLNAVCQMQLDGEGVLPGRRMTTAFHTSHPTLAAALRRSPVWRQVSGVLHGGNRAKSRASVNSRTPAAWRKTLAGASSGFGGHLRAVQGFRYYGQKAV